MQAIRGSFKSESDNVAEVADRRLAVRDQELVNIHFTLCCLLALQAVLVGLSVAATFLR